MFKRQSKTMQTLRCVAISTASTWLGVYPLLTVLAFVLDPLLSEQAFYIRTLVMSAMMVPLMMLLIMPLMNKITAKFLLVIKEIE